MKELVCTSLYYGIDIPHLRIPIRYVGHRKRRVRVLWPIKWEVLHEPTKLRSFSPEFQIGISSCLLTDAGL